MVAWVINGTDQFATWYTTLAESQQDSVVAVVELMAEQAPQLDLGPATR